MLERSRRRRLLVAPVALLALAAAVGGSASASRPRPTVEDAFARAVALQVNAAASVVAEAHGNDTSSVSGPSFHVPGVLELATAQSTADTQLGSGLRARAGTHLGHLHLKASAVRIHDLTARILSGAETAVEKVLLAACTLDSGGGVEAVATAAVNGVTLGAASTSPATPWLDGSLEAELRAAAGAALDAEDLSEPWCGGRLDQLTKRVVAAIEPPVRTTLEAHLSVSLTALRTTCDLGRQAGTAHTELVAHERTAALLGFDGETRGDSVLVRVAPDTGVDLGGGVSLVLNQQHRTHRPGREAQITVHGAVLRVEGIVVATVASSHCRLWGDVAPDAGGEDTVPTPGAGVSAEAHVSVAGGSERESRLASFTAAAYIRATRHR